MKNLLKVYRLRTKEQAKMGDFVVGVYYRPPHHGGKKRELKPTGGRVKIPCPGAYGSQGSVLGPV